MKLAVGFITYNEASAPYLSYFLPSLKTALDFFSVEDYQILVYDNSDLDYKLNQQSLENFQKLAPLIPVHLSATGENQGFSQAYNILINQARKAGAEYFLMINPDTILEPSAIVTLVQALDQDIKLAAVSPKIKRWDFIKQQKTNFIDSVGVVLQPGLKFSDLGQGEIDHGQFDYQSILGPSGAAGLFRLSDLEKIKENGQYFDENFFMYKEDCDLDYRLSIAGLLAKLVPEAIIYHDRTAAVSQAGLRAWLLNRRQKSQKIRSWSFLNQHLIFVKYWHIQNFYSRVIIILRCLTYLFFSLILEQYNLKNYKKILSFRKVLTNIK